MTDALDRLLEHYSQRPQAAPAEETGGPDPAPVVVTAVPIVPEQRRSREAELLGAVVANRPQWLPAKPLREALIRTAALTHGVRRAMSGDVRDRIAVEMQLEVRRSRRHRKAQLKALRRYLRSGDEGAR